MDTLTSRLLSSTNFWSMWKMGRAASMWSEMSHKSCFISSVVVAEKDELLFFHLIHMSICLLSVPLSKDYWCPVFDIWHIAQSSFSSCELTQRGSEKNANLTAISQGDSFTVPLCSPGPLPHPYDHSHPSSFSAADLLLFPASWYWADREQRASWVAKFGGKLFIWPLHVSTFYNLVCVTPVSSS